MRRRFVVRVIEPWQTCFSAMQHQISRSQVIHLCIMAPLQRGLSRAYFTYDRDCDGRLRPSPFREGIGYLRPRRFAHCIDFITDQGRSGFPLRPCGDCRKSGFTTFSRKLRCVLRLCCPLIADNSTLTPRKVFSATHMSRQKTDHTAFASADAKLCEAFFDKLTKAAAVFRCGPVRYWSLLFTAGGQCRRGCRRQRTAPVR